jgi:SAM-dependent methyltransferase
MNAEPTSVEFFEQRYRRDLDYWDFATSPYEQDRYRTLLDHIGPGPFAAAYEPGCSIGVFTELLARRCDRLLATDPSPTAVAAAAERCAPHPHVEVVVGGLPGDLRDRNGEPTRRDRERAGRFDLIVFSEVGYYFDVAALEGILADVCEALRPNGILIGTHWTGRSEDHRMQGAEVHATINRQACLLQERQEAHPGFLLGCWRRR